MRYRTIDLPLYEMIDYETKLKAKFREKFERYVKRNEYFIASQTEALTLFDEFRAEMEKQGMELFDCPSKGNEDRVYIEGFVNEEVPGGIDKFPDWTDKYIPSVSNMEYWKNYDGKDAAQSRAVFDRVQSVARKLYVDPLKVDDTFYKTYVCNKHVVKRVLTFFNTIQTSAEDNRGRLARVLNEISTEGENMRVYRMAVEKRYIAQLYGQEMLENMLAPEEYDKLKNFENGALKRDTVKDWVTGQLAALSPEKKRSLAQCLGSDDLPKKNTLSFGNLVMQSVFHLKIEPKTKTRAVKQASYQLLVIDMKLYRDLRDVYKSGLFTDE